MQPCPEGGLLGMTYTVNNENRKKILSREVLLLTKNCGAFNNLFDRWSRLPANP